MNHGYNEIQIAMKTINKTLNFVNSIKDILDNVEKNNVVYRKSCDNCNNVFIGHTGMTIKKKIYYR